MGRQECGEDYDFAEEPMWNAILEEVREEEGKDDSELVWFEAESGDEGLRIIVADKEPSSWLLL